MRVVAIPSPKTGRERVEACFEAYFLENRTRVLDVVAFPDRLDCAARGGPAQDAAHDRWHDDHGQSEGV